MPVPSDYFYKADPVRGSGYWKSDGTGPYFFNGSTMVLMNMAGISQVGLSGTAATQGQFWDLDDSSGPVTVRG